MHVYEVVAGDGTVLRAWRHGRGGYPVLGIGTIPEMWPSLLAPAAKLPVHGWQHRSSVASRQAGEPEPGALDDHVADGIAVLDAAGVHRCVVVGWSFGVSVGVRLALRYPDRVGGLLMVAGVPGAMPEIPVLIRSTLLSVLTQGLRLAGPLLAEVLPRLPVTPATVWPLRHSGLLRPTADPFDTARAVRRFLQQHWDWFCGLALADAAHPAPDLRLLHCPITVLAGQHDVVTDLQRVTRRLAAVPQARLRILPTSHFVSLEAPEVVLEEVRALQHRAAAVEVAVQAVIGTALTSGSRHAT